MRAVVSVAILVPLVIQAGEVRCPAYPEDERRRTAEAWKLQRSAAQFAASQRKSTSRTPRSAGVNYIDDRIFGRMAADNVVPAGNATGEEFLRRVSLDLTGRIPTADEAAAFRENTDPGKRAAAIDSLLASDAYVDYFTLWFGNLFEVTSTYYSFIGITGRNLFHAHLRDFVREDRSYADFAAGLIAAAGDSHQAGPPNYVMRGIQFSEPVQDTWDEMTNRITTVFFGVQTQCVSCHHGRRHLEPINDYLSKRTRQNFWEQAAFLSRMTILEVPVDARNQQRKGVISDRTAGGYHVVLVDPSNPGVRPPRTGGPYSATFMFNGEKPKTGEWRKELARLITTDRQFARAAVNYLWAHFFRTGIVDPANGWDLNRIDPSNLPPDGYMQSSHPELLEDLANDFIANGYRIKPIIRRMVETAAYQLSTRYDGQWRPEYARYFARQTPRRLKAEELYDALVAATNTPIPLIVEGFDKPVQFAGQLPDPAEPRLDEGYVLEFLRLFGRGDWFRTPRNSDSNSLQALYLMNHPFVVSRTFGVKYFNASSRVAQLASSTLTDEEAIHQIFLSALARRATDAEAAAAVRAKRGTREEWLSDVQWAVLNKLEFMFCF